MCTPARGERNNGERRVDASDACPYCPAMIVAKNFISFAEVTEPIGHHVNNEWHHLDHLP